MQVRSRTGTVIIGAIALLAVGCGRADDGEDVTTVKEIDVLQEATAAGTFRATITAEETLDDGDGALVTTIEMTGVVDPAAGAFDLEGSFSTAPVAPEGAVDELDLVQGSTVGFRSDGTDEWVRYGADDAQWVVLVDERDDPDDPTDDAEDDADDAEDDADDAEGDAVEDDPLERFLDPAAFLDQVREHATTFTEVGSEDLDGVATTHYRATGGDDDLGTVEVWVDEQDRPRRLETAGATMTFTDYDVPVAITAPAGASADDADVSAALATVFPQVTGEWTELSSGAGWTVWQADATAGDVATHCWTFEPDGASGDLPFDIPDEASGFLDAVPSHGGVTATCPSGFSGGAPSSDPAAIVIDPGVLSDSRATAIRVSDRFADGPVELVFEDGSSVEVPVDEAGIAVPDLDADQADDEGTEVVEVRLADGSVSCPAAGYGGTVVQIGICVAA